MDAVRIHRKRGLRVELIGQRPLDQSSSLPGALRSCVRRRHLHAAFLPIELKPGLASFLRGFVLPSDVLSRETSLVQVNWWCAADDWVTLRWTEVGGTPVNLPAHQGFGTNLMGRVIQAHVAGGVFHRARRWVRGRGLDWTDAAGVLSSPSGVPARTPVRVGNGHWR
jgi:hypothetical protein